MRNLIVLKESRIRVNLNDENRHGYVSNIKYDNDKGDLLTCTDDGVIIQIPSSEGKISAWLACDESAQRCTGWFHCSLIAETGMILAISYAGNMISIRPDNDGLLNSFCDFEGCVDSGIVAAGWNPDQSSLLLVTGNDSLLVMTNTLDVMQEVAIEPRIPGSPCALAWSGDGEYCCLYIVPVSDGIPRIKVFSKLLEPLCVARAVMDGAASVVKDLFPVVAIAPNGTLIASVNKKNQSKFQLLLFERNGLRHGEFDIQIPDIEGRISFDREPSGIWFDISSTMLAVSFRPIAKDEVSPQYSDYFVQVYYRENYHWYLKQQWTGDRVCCHGFDTELFGRLYLSFKTDIETVGIDIRVMDLSWEVSNSCTSDCTVAVIDGCEVLLTPLGSAVVPPPMCLYRTPRLANVCRHASFWASDKKSTISSSGNKIDAISPAGWGLACLLDGNLFQLFFGGNTTRGFTGSTGAISLHDYLELADLKYGICRQILVQDKFSDGAENIKDLSVIIVVTPARIVEVSIGSSLSVQDLSEDILLILNIKCSVSIASSCEVQYGGKIVITDGIVGGLSHWGSRGFSEIDDYECSNEQSIIGSQSISIAVAVFRTDISFAVLKVCVQGSNELNGNSAGDIISALYSTSGIYIIPEPCTKIAVTVPDDSASSNCGVQRTAVLGISTRNHLYCGEILIATGVSTLSLNTTLKTLLYATMGTRPMLNFVPLGIIYSLDPMQPIDENNLHLFTAEPRPLERGSRIIATVPGAAKVILQMPRGNLETCEPRYLALRCVRLMLDAQNIFECLVFLRRQRIDMNILFDYNPDSFLATVPLLVKKCMKTNPEFISLFISSLEAGDVTQVKYVTDFYSDRNHQQWSKDPIVTRPDKINIICSSIRSALLLSLIGEQQLSLPNADYSEIITPILCTFARQHPPRLVDALNLVTVDALNLLHRLTLEESEMSRALQTIVSERGTVSVLGGKLFNNSKSQALIKYIAFLADKEELFNAALGDCDFSMSRAIAKQCQMDPKVYMPLLEHFEAIGSLNSYSFSSEIDGTQKEMCRIYAICKMRFSVLTHLKRYADAIEWGIAAISLDFSNENSKIMGIDDFFDDIFTIIEDNELQEIGIKRLRTILSQCKIRPNSILSFPEAICSPSDVPNPANISALGALFIRKLLSRVLISCGSKASAHGNYRDGTAAFLSADPPGVSLAIQAARSNKDWQLAISIAARYAYTAGVISVSDLVDSIVEEFQGGLEQGQSETDDYFNSFPSTIDFSSLMKYDSENAKVAQAASLESPVNFKSFSNTDAQSIMESDRSLEIANMCIDYLDGDVQRATDVLVAARTWTHAVRIALRFKRIDLIKEIGDFIRSAAKDAIATLKQRGRRHGELVEYLKKIWSDPANRLQLVTESDPALTSIVAREKRLLRDGYGIDKGIVDDVGEHKIIGDDGRSEYSRATFRSYATEASIRSGVSTVSVLSNLSRYSNTGSTVSDSSSFSIHGIEHSLLSRGSIGESGNPKTMNLKQKKRNEKHQKGNKGGAHGGQDIFNLRGENSACTELCQFCDITVVACAVFDILDALLLLGDFASGDIDLAISLQKQMNEYTTYVVSMPPPSAPLYPVEWLQRKNMHMLRCFQEWPVLNSDLVPTVGTVHNKTVPTLLWWKLAADGIIYWRRKKVDVLDL